MAQLVSVPYKVMTDDQGDQEGDGGLGARMEPHQRTQVPCCATIESLPSPKRTLVCASLGTQQRKGNLLSD